MFRFEFQKLWIIYLVTSTTIFTLPPPVFSQYQSNYLRTPRNETNPAEPTGGGTTGPSGDPERIEGSVDVANVKDKNEGGAEPETSGSAPLVREALMADHEGDNIVSAESRPHRRFRTRRLRPSPHSHSHSPSKSRHGHPYPPHSDPEDEPRRPPRRHQPPRIHMKTPRDPGPREKPVLLKPSKLSKPKKPILSVPKLRSKPFFERFRNKPQHPLRHEDSREQREREYERTPPSPRVPATPSPPPSRPIRESMETSAGTSVEMKLRPESVRHSHGPPSSIKAKEISKAILEQLFPSGQDGSILSAENKARGGDHKSHSHNHNHQPHPASSSVTHTPFAHKTKVERPAEGYIVTDDKQELNELWENHHLRRRKECDGLENFIYDLEVIAFLLGVVAGLIGLYADVIPFFNEGVKISYNNDALGDGVDFPHDYWPKHDTHVEARTISIGTNEDEIKEVLSVTGEFIGLLGLGISFVGLFPSLVEKFFYSLDWWFGKRGLWKQYLYTYKCEVHKYPQPGWGKVG